MSEPTHDPELAALREALARLRPAPGAIDLGQLLFRAGQASVRRRGWAWPGATAAVTLLAAGLGAVLLFRPVPQPAERVVIVRVETPAPPAESAAREQPSAPVAPPTAAEGADRGPRLADSLRLRQQVLARGVEALPEPAPWPDAPPAVNPGPLLDVPAGAVPGPWLRNLKNALQSGGAS
jgi:hypothetical protein